jgi:hypothetical protein
MTMKVFVDLTRFAATADRATLREMVARLEDAGATGVSVSDHLSTRARGNRAAKASTPVATR